MQAESDKTAEKTARRYHSPRRAQAATETRAGILAAAKRLFVEQGYGKVTVNDIATEAALAVPTVYACTGGKSAILSTIIDEAIRDPIVEETLSAIRQSSAAHDVIGVTAHGTRVDNERYRDIMQVMAGGCATWTHSNPVSPRNEPLTRCGFTLDAKPGTCWWPTGTGRGMTPRNGSASRPPRHCSNINESRDTLKRRADPAINPPIEADEKGPHLCGPFQWSCRESNQSQKSR
jgi:AcrR family transcriptional regulator